MNRISLRALWNLALAALLLAACAPAATPVPPTATAAPSPVPPTATSVPPTATSAPTATVVPPTATAEITSTTSMTGTPGAEMEEKAEFFPQTPPSTSAGAKVYTANCVACHGPKGDGKGAAAAALKPAPTDFTDPEHAYGDAPQDWYKSITEGLPNTAMPAYKGKLSETDVWNVLFYTRNFITTPASIAAGKALYATNCAACHGDKGDGKGPASAALKPEPSDFTDAQMMATHASKELFDTLTNGKGTMPAFKDKFTDVQRWSLVNYLWTFQYKP